MIIHFKTSLKTPLTKLPEKTRNIVWVKNHKEPGMVRPKCYKEPKEHIKRPKGIQRTICLTRRHKGKFGPKNHKKPQGTLKNPNNTMESSGTRRSLKET